MTQVPSRRRINALGEALRAGATPASSGMQDVYDNLMVAAVEAMQPVQDTVMECIGISARVSARPKTLDTMCEKLIRMPTLRLASMDDLIGVRVVSDMTLGAQDAMASRIKAAFPGSHQKDRRAQPIAGYRAVHVIAPLGAFHAEIQIRTRLQSAWAEIFESTADRWGRGIRYGLPPQAPPGGDPSQRAQLVQLLQELSLESIAANEELRQQLSDLLDSGSGLPATDESRRELLRLRPELDEQATSLYKLLERVAILVEHTE